MYVHITDLRELVHRITRIYMLRKLLAYCHNVKSMSKNSIAYALNNTRNN